VPFKVSYNEGKVWTVGSVKGGRVAAGKECWVVTGKEVRLTKNL
jgi:hypothetical protein